MKLFALTTLTLLFPLSMCQSVAFTECASPPAELLLRSAAAPMSDDPSQRARQVLSQERAEYTRRAVERGDKLAEFGQKWCGWK